MRIDKNVYEIVSYNKDYLQPMAMATSNSLL